MIREHRIPVLMALLAIFLLACGPVATVVVTATPEPTPATGTTPPPATPAPPSAAPPTEAPPEPTTAAGCTLGARWVADVTVPDNTPFAPGTAFVKTWRIRNSGTCNWEPGTQLVFVSGNPMGGPAAVSVPATAAGAQTDISVNLTAPAVPGTYRGNWQLQAPDGTRFGAVIWVQIVVPGPTTPAPVCAPPACATGEVLHCPGTCPGGCGVVCVTPTRPPSALAILSFTVSAEDLPPAGKRLTFRWRTTGATSATIWSSTQMRSPRSWAATPTNEGSLTVEVPLTFYRDPRMTLVARDTAGNEVSASVDVPWACRYSYFFPTDSRACPAYEASATWAAEESFERGRMIWLQEVRTESAVYPKVILVFYNDGRFEKHPDTWTEGEPESDPSIVPPAGLYQPIRGFGKLWRTNAAVRDRLGWATAPEQGFNTFWQMQMAESIGIPFFVRRIDGRVIRAAGWDMGSGSWQEVP